MNLFLPCSHMKMPLLTWCGLDLLDRPEAYALNCLRTKMAAGHVHGIDNHSKPASSFPKLRWLSLHLENRKCKEKTHRAIWGGETYCRVPPPEPLLEASESGICLVWAPFLQLSSKENDMAWANGGGGTYHRWGGGSKTVFGEGFYGIFSPPLSFHPPLFLVTRELLPWKPYPPEIRRLEPTFCLSSGIKRGVQPPYLRRLGLSSCLQKQDVLRGLKVSVPC